MGYPYPLLVVSAGPFMSACGTNLIVPMVKLSRENSTETHEIILRHTQRLEKVIANLG
jgi:hypothetical protein